MGRSPFRADTVTGGFLHVQQSAASARAQQAPGRSLCSLRLMPSRMRTDYRLVALSVFIAILASYAALDLAGRVTSARGTARLLWLTGRRHRDGHRHLVDALHRHAGVPACRCPVQYDWPTVLLSLVAAILASAVALFVVSRPADGARAGARRQPVHGRRHCRHALHRAWRRCGCAAVAHYSPALVALSVVLAVVISLVALWLAFHFRERNDAVELDGSSPAPLVMGAAIPVMHYTGMAAAHFHARRHSATAITSHAIGVVVAERHRHHHRHADGPRAGRGDGARRSTVFASGAGARVEPAASSDHRNGAGRVRRDGRGGPHHRLERAGRSGRSDGRAPRSSAGRWRT